MGLGDEIMALGRAESLFEKTGKPVNILDKSGRSRVHPAWHGNPAWDSNSDQTIIDGPGARPYIKEWRGDQIIFNMDYRARAGKICQRGEVYVDDPLYAVISPILKENASPNKQFGIANWEEVIKDFPIPVYQLSAERVTPIKGARLILTPRLYDAYTMIENAELVLTNEGGSHHMAASARRRAVVFFGAFVPPSVTGYSFHENISAVTKEGFCGNFSPCDHCKKAIASISPELVRQSALNIINGNA